MSAPRFSVRDRVRAIDVSPAAGSKRKPSFREGHDLVVAAVSADGQSINLVSHAGFWRVERFA